MAQNDSKSIVNLSIPDKFVNLNDRLSQMEQRFSNVALDVLRHPLHFLAHL